MRNKKTLWVLISLLLMVSLMVGGCGKSDKPAEQTPAADTTQQTAGATRISLGTASIGGVYYVYGAGVAQVLTKHVPNLEVGAEVTGGPVVNIGLIQSGKIQMGLTTDSTASEAYNGKDWANNTKYDKIRAIVPMYPSGLQIFAIKGKGFTKLQDYNGKIVGLGPAGGTVDVVGRNIMNVLNIKPSKIQNLGWSDTIGNMKDLLVHGAMDVGGFPHPSRQELEATHEIEWIELSAEDKAKVQAAYPYYLDGVIPAGTYKTMTKDYNTLFIWNEVICDKDMSEEMVYNITKAILENNEELKLSHSSAKDTLAENVSKITIPLHPGAIKYYLEKGIKLSDNQYPPEYKK